MSSALTVEHVVKAYAGGGKVVLDDVSFRAEPGELLVLVGPSGCGKSTMLRSVAGLEGVSSGRILIGGRDVTPLAPKDRDIAMVFQDYALYPHKTVYENVAFGLRVRGTAKDRIDPLVREAAAKLDLTPLLARRPASLSGGQRQRVAIGRAIVRSPEVFLFDEPLSNLDAKLRSSMRLTIARLHQELRATMVYVTHDQVEAMTLADRIIVLDSGKVQQHGTPLELYHHPRNVFVATFIGSPAMNLVDGVVEDGTFVAPGGFRAPLSPERLAGVRAGQAVTLGLRPEDLELAGSGADFTAEAQVTELLGPASHVLCTVAGHELLLTIPAPARPRPGDRLPLAWRSPHLYLFDKTSGLSLVRP